MISRLLSPSAVRRFMYAIVGSWLLRRRTMTMVQRAELAWRSPARLSRWRLVLPDETRTGLLPHSAA